MTVAQLIKQLQRLPKSGDPCEWTFSPDMVAAVIAERTPTDYERGFEAALEIAARIVEPKDKNCQCMVCQRLMELAKTIRKASE